MTRVLIRCSLVLAASMAITDSPAWAAPILSPLSTQTIVDAFAANTFLDSGTSRTTAGTGPMTDSVHEFYLTNTADAFATIDPLGHLHADASLVNAVGDGVTGQSRAIPSIVNPFMLVPQAGFVGTHALVEFGYHLTGTVADTANCESCFEVIQARLDVDGLGQSFFFLGTRSEGTKSNPGYLNGPLDTSGMLIGLLPVNTELFLRASLLTSTLCQSWADLMCTSDSTADFSFTGVSSEPVDFIWGLDPREPDVPSVPEPAISALLGIGLLLLGRRLRAGRPSVS